MAKQSQTKQKPKWKNKHKTKNGVTYDIYWSQIQSAGGFQWRRK